MSAAGVVVVEVGVGRGIETMDEERQVEVDSGAMDARGRRGERVWKISEHPRAWKARETRGRSANIHARGRRGKRAWKISEHPRAWKARETCVEDQ